MAKVMRSGLRAAHACGPAGHAIAALRGTRLRPDGPCAPGVASRAPAVSHPRLRGVANRPRAPSAARTHRECLSTARSTAPATGASTRQTPSGGFAFLRRRPLEGRKRTVGVVGRGGGVAAGPSRAASAPLALWVEGAALRQAPRGPQAHPGTTCAPGALGR